MPTVLESVKAALAVEIDVPGGPSMSIVFHAHLRALVELAESATAVEEGRWHITRRRYLAALSAVNAEAGK